MSVAGRRISFGFTLELCVDKSACHGREPLLDPTPAPLEVISSIPPCPVPIPLPDIEYFNPFLAGSRYKYIRVMRRPGDRLNTVAIVTKIQHLVNNQSELVIQVT